MQNPEETKSTKIRPTHTNVNLKCRFYEQKFPQPEDLVVVRRLLVPINWKVEIVDVVENGAYVRLLEYNDIEGNKTLLQITF